MSEHDTTPADGQAADPLARIGARLIDAAVTQRRRRRRQHLQRAAGAALTLLLIVVAVVAARPFAGGDAPAPATDRSVGLDAGDGRFTVYATGERTICANRPDGRNRHGMTMCAWSGVVSALLRREVATAWVYARAVGDRVVVTGLAAPDARVVAAAPPRGGGLGVEAESRPGGPTVTVGRLGGPPLVARPFTVSLPRTGAASVTVATPSSVAGAPTIVQRVRITAPPDDLAGYAKLFYRVPDAAQITERVAARLQHLTPPPGGRNTATRAQVLGEGDEMIVWVPGSRVAAARQALTPGVVQVFDWEANVLLPDDTTVAHGLARAVPRATTISRGAGSSTGMTLAEARDQLRRQRGPARIVQADGPLEDGLPLRRDDPRARFYVLRGQPALRGAEGVVAGSVGSAGGVARLQLRFDEAQVGKLRQVTRKVSQRGQDLMLPGTPSAAVAQHLAVVLDDRVVTLAPIDPAELPDGVTGSTLVLPDSFARRGLRELADKLRLGQLPLLRELG